MGVYADYLNQGMDFEALTKERKAQLTRISELRERDVLVYAADLNAPQQAPVSVNYTDLLPISDQLAGLDGDRIDLLLETPGGSGEVAEDIVDLLHGQYEEIGVIVPGTAKSAGTLMVMAANEILMSPASSLGPIDAQIQWQGKVFSAEAFLEGLNEIKKEVTKTGELNPAYIPILQGVSPGEIQAAENNLEFARKLVTDWLARYKFKNWDRHSSSGEPVTEQERKKRAREVAKDLCNHSKWLSHGRSIKLHHLREMRLLITNYEEQAELSDAIRRYHTLLQMTFATEMYKVFETPTSQIYRALRQQPPAPVGAGPLAVPPNVASAEVEVPCVNCNEKTKVQANLKEGVPIADGAVGFPEDNKLKCPHCGAETDLTALRQQIEAQAQRPVVAAKGGSNGG